MFMQDTIRSVYEDPNLKDTGYTIYNDIFVFLFNDGRVGMMRDKSIECNPANEE